MRKYLSILLPLSAAILWLFAACKETVSDAQQESHQPSIYPDYVGVTIPVNIAPLNFSMADDDALLIDAVITDRHGHSLHSQGGASTDFDLDDWHQLIAQSVGDSLSVSVSAKYADGWHTYRTFPLYVSADSIDFAVTYRRIAPGYEVWSKMGIYQRNLSTFTEEVLLENTAIGGQCINCHTANHTNPDQYVFHVRGAHGATVLHHDGHDELLKAKSDLLGGAMVYPYWHPSGRFCVFSTNKTLQTFHAAGPKRVEVYDNSSDVFVYDVKNHTVLLDTLTMHDRWAENTPAFSPDGRWLYFTTAQCQSYPTDYDQERYSLCRVSFDAQTGRLGQQVDTLVSAALTGKSASWPRPSYDGRYVLFTQTDYGYFSVWHPEADLWLYDVQTRQSHPLPEVNSQEAESLHAWSSNSRWFLFTSRRDDGLFTRLYFSHITPDGRVTKPFLLPQRNPKEYYRQLFYSYNTPDFISRPVKMDARRMSRQIMSDERIPTQLRMMK